MERFFRKWGIHQTQDRVFYVVAVIGALLLSLGAIFAAGVAGGVVLLLLCLAILSILLHARREQMRKLFRKHAYRIYKYISNQVKAGVLPRDALTQMHEVVEDRRLASILEQVCGMYSATLDAGKAGELLLSHIDSEEARSLVTFLCQDMLETGDPGRIERLETLMFNRYFAYIQQQTDQVRNKCVLTVLALSLLIVLMILIPLFMDIQEALDNIFIT